ncbi:hypothetical protein ACFY1L_05435 [Streptomyces sp. NPDC001663]|uniref:hypothetical protein n=1 Tax=Streptomyces sp. NPDC001663 TaxID=3364597 RepID=UPI003691D161
MSIAPGRFERYAQSTWSTSRHLPGAALTDGGKGAAHLALFGPDDASHQWRRTLTPGEQFTTVPAVLVRASLAWTGPSASSPPTATFGATGPPADVPDTGYSLIRPPETVTA